MTETLLNRYISEIFSSAGNHYRDNFDPYRFGPEPAEAGRPAFRRMISGLARRAGYQRTELVKRALQAAMLLVAPSLPRLESVYRQLADEESRQLLVKLLAYRALGYRKVRLPLSTPEYWRGLQEIERLADFSNARSIPFGGSQFILPLIDLRSLGRPLRLYALPIGAFTQCVLEHYRSKTNGQEIGVGPGDIVIDAGGCWGDTALNFALHAGASGKIFSYEFMPRNLEVFSENLELNPELAPSIHLVEKAAWVTSGVRLSFQENGPGTYVKPDEIPAQNAVTTLSIDDLVQQAGLPRVDFIKMDIEGCELQALQGAEHTLRSHRPDLAISLYHKFADLTEIPEYILSLDLGYRLYIRHFTIHVEETVLFASCNQN